MTRSKGKPIEHINRIRHAKFGLLPDGRSLGPNALADDLHQATENLSEGLYSKDIHFILELVQNADDNAYAPGCQPDLEFQLLKQDPTGTPGADGALLVVNNELGFRPSHVEALCAVGKTTKTKREGYIGEKGIGFKSVFLVSARPHIFSRGYQFRFDGERDQAAELGYIVPYWIDRVPEEVGKQKGKTCILLPLKAGKRDLVADELEGFPPETILFLAKLQGLTIRIPDLEPMTVRRDDIQRPLVTLVTTEGMSEYWVAEADFAVPPEAADEKRVGVEARRVSIACPLSGKVPDRSVHAYLPTEVPSGFPFLLNADFVLSASRESIQVDRPWNCWLRDCVAPTFVDAFVSLVHDPVRRFSAYQFIPVQATGEFFAPVTEQIHDTLAQQEVVWACAGDRPMLPSLTRCVTDEFRGLLDYDRLPEPLGDVLPVHPEIAPFGEQLRAIGVANLTEDEIIACLRDDAWMDGHGRDWYVRLYRYLGTRSWGTAERLQALNLLVTDEGRRTSALTQPVYFPTDGAEEVVQVVRELFSSAPHLPSGVVAFLDEDVYSAVRDDHRMMRCLRDALGVSDPSVGQFCLDLAGYLDRHADEIPTADLVRLTEFICDHYDELDYGTKRAVREQLPLALANGRYVRQGEWSAEHPLVMPEAVDPDAGWQLVFLEPEDRAHMLVLSDAYIDGNNKRSRQKWARFLHELGATSAPEPRLRQWSIGYYSEKYMPPDIPNHLRALMLSERQGSTNGYEVQDWAAPGWLRELTNRSPERAVIKRAKALLGWLPGISTDYQGKPRSFSAHYEWHYYTWRSSIWPSELKHCLMNAPWFPSTKGLCRPHEVFVDRPEIREIFGDSVSYAPPDTSDKVVRWLGLRATATASDLLGYLEALASNPASEADADVVRRIYRRLQLSPIDAEVFAEQPLLLVSQPEPRWVTSDQCVWPDLADVFGDTYVYLAREYGEDYRGFFTDKLGIPRQMDDQLYAQAWRQLEQETTAPPEKVEAALEMIFTRLSRIVRGDDKPEWWDEFRQNACVWTQSDRFVPASQAFIPDDGELRDALRGTVEFAWRPEKDSFADHRALYHELGVRSLADSVTMAGAEVLTADGGTEDSLLTPAAKRGICLHLWNEQKPDYERVKTSGLLEALLTTREVLSESLSVTFGVDGHIVTLDDRQAYWDARTRVLYRRASFSEQLEIEVALILARRLASGERARALENLIGRVLGSSDAKIDGMAQRHNWSFPEEEQAWVAALLVEPGSSSDANNQPDEVQREAERSAEEEGAPATSDESGDTDVDGSGDGEGDRPPGESPDRDIPREPREQPPVGRKEYPDDRSTDPRTGQPPRDRRTQPSGRLPDWLVSYVVIEDDDGEGGSGHGDPEVTRKRQEVDAAGVAHVLAFEREYGRTPRQMPHNHPGYDIESSDGKGRRRYIEVKSLSDAWTPASPVGLTSTEFDAARELGDRCWLYVVEHALDDQCSVFAIQDPANRVVRFYFDHGWKAVSEDAMTEETP